MSQEYKDVPGVAREVKQDSPWPSNVRGSRQAENNLSGKLDDVVLTVSRLAGTAMPERARLIGDWFREGDLGFVYGARGEGKTWFVQRLITSAASGLSLFDWSVECPIKCLYFDGEMPGVDMQARLLGMSPCALLDDDGNAVDGGMSENLLTVNHEVVFDKTGLSMNLTEPQWQNEILRYVVANDCRIIVLDNLSSLCFGMEENSNDDWELMLPWLLTLRRHKIAVVIVHHAGTAGRMRGASRREDHAFWVIKCERIPDHDRPEGEQGIRFRTRFEKQRNSQVMEISREWHFVTDVEGVVSCSCSKASFDDIVSERIQAGLESASDIAQELNVAKSTVSKAAKRLEEKGRITINGRKYVHMG
jgi:hypothetical protein